ncbi:MAG: OmpA family protein [Methylococcales bacterium]
MKKNYLLILSLLFSHPLYADCQQGEIIFNQATANKNLQQALDEFQQSATLCPNYTVYYEQGRTLFKLERSDEALQSFKQALHYSEANSGNEANALARIALVYFKKDAMQQASLYVEKAYIISKQNSPHWILRLRKDIDIQNASHIASAKEIKQALLDGKNFGVRTKIKFNSITFKFNSTEFTPQGQQQVAELGKALVDHLTDRQQALIIGHTDKIGDETYNQTLSEQRAEKVKKALVGINPAYSRRIKTQGKGESELRYFGDSEQDHQLNRRVEMQLP